MDAQSLQCPQCKTSNPSDARFCFRCGATVQAGAPPPPIAGNNKTVWITLGIIFAIFGSCGLCGIIGKLSDKPTNTASSNSNIASTTATASSAATPKPTLAELQQRAEPLLTLQKEEYVEDDLKAYDAVIGPLKEIPKDSRSMVRRKPLSRSSPRRRQESRLRY